MNNTVTRSDYAITKDVPGNTCAVVDCYEDGQHEEIHHRCEELFQALVHASLRTHFDRLSAEETLYLVTGDGERVQIPPEMYGPLTSVRAHSPTARMSAWYARTAS